MSLRKSQREGRRVRLGDATTESESGKRFEDGGRNHGARGADSLWKLEKARAQTSLSFQEEHTLILGLPDYQIIHLCFLKPISS